MLLSEINIAYYQRLMQDIRDAIAKGSFPTILRTDAGAVGAGRYCPAERLVQIRLAACLVTKPYPQVSQVQR